MTYYLGVNKDLSVEASVISLIMFIARQNNISFDHIISCGSSKGGFAALYFGLKYGFGFIIAGAPQYLLGQFLIKRDLHSIAITLAGGIGDGDRRYLNSILTSVVQETKTTPKIFIHVGREIFIINAMLSH